MAWRLFTCLLVAEVLADFHTFSSSGNTAGFFGAGTQTGMASGVGSGLASGIGPGLTSGIGGGMSSGIGSGLASGVGPEMASGIGPSLASGIGPGLASGIGGGMSSGIGPGLASGIGPGLASGIGPGFDSGIGPGLASGIGGGTASGVGPGMSSGVGPGMASGIGSGIPAGIGSRIAAGIATGIGTAAVLPIEGARAFIGSTQCPSFRKIAGMAYEAVEGEKEPDLNQLTLEYRDPASRILTSTASAARTILQAWGRHPRSKLIVLIHGFTGDSANEGYNSVSDALINQGEGNILALDGSSLFHWLYLRSSNYVRSMGQQLAEVLATLTSHGMNPTAIHIIGDGLGAHIAGFTGKTFTQLTNGHKLGRISGLDPSGPCFSHVDPELWLQATDASFVDVIHTDYGEYGLKEAIGDVDFYPNSGSQQPNCVFQTCGYSRAWLYYAESVLNPQAFPARRCDGWEGFRNGKCDASHYGFMGYPSNPNLRGHYFLQTGQERPYGIGEKGTSFFIRDAFVKTVEMPWIHAKGIAEAAGGFFG